MVAGPPGPCISSSKCTTIATGIILAPAAENRIGRARHGAQAE
jgi:hypothetical protein